ncbi:flavodoxin domain-containing protein [Haloechinothrix halophila]|uniref:flavodoxin domain-containing protein n=1 Tax=Haloechinothrix halophila TaxID=1069073 RepID=UPI000429951C|nr:flavodoxin domain-containing protein [Haloechinothrix halophila]
MRILVTYASKYGATEGIAEHIARTLDAAGHTTIVRPTRANDDLGGYHAYVIGSAVYLGKWLSEARKVVRRNTTALAGKPVWLFSSGPLDVAITEAAKRKQLAEATPKHIAELTKEIRPRGHRMFSGSLDAARLTRLDRLVRMSPGGKALLPDGDFRDWSDIKDWATEIALELDELPAGTLPDDRRT